MADNLSSSIGLLGSIFPFISALQEHLEKKEIESDLKEMLDYPISNFVNSADKLIFATYSLEGANRLGKIISPFDYEKSADKLVSNLEIAFAEFEEDAKRLTSNLKVHQDSIKKVFGKDWAKFEVIFHGVNDSGIDYKLFFENYGNSLKSNKNDEFNQILNKKLQKKFGKKFEGLMSENELKKFYLESNIDKEQIRELKDFLNAMY